MRSNEASNLFLWRTYVRQMMHTENKNVKNALQNLKQIPRNLIVNTLFAHFKTKYLFFQSLSATTISNCSVDFSCEILFLFWLDSCLSMRNETGEHTFSNGCEFNDNKPLFAHTIYCYSEFRVLFFFISVTRLNNFKRNKCQTHRHSSRTYLCDETSAC